MKRFLFFLGIMLLACVLHAQEDCFNGEDDDNDGLIDLWDTECYCVETNGTLYFSDFETFNCCPWRFTIPTAPGGIDCLSGMSSATEATSDYFNTCNYLGSSSGNGPPFVPFPIPSGEGVVGTISTSTYVEYIGTCLPTELIAGFEYEFSMMVGFNSNPVLVSLSPFVVAIYGTTDCANYPVMNDDCLNTNPNWYQIGTMTVSGNLGEWSYVSGSFTAPFNTAAIAFGGHCLSETTANNYHFFDDFMISGPGNPQLEVDEITAAGDCASGITLSTSQLSGASYQWYLNGIAIAGATGPNYSIPPGGEGTYKVMTIKNGLCGISPPFELEIDENVLTWSEDVQQILCFGNNDGYIDLQLPGNHPPYEVIWSNGQSTPLAESLAPGHYIATVTDGYGCFGVKEYDISSPEVLDVFLNYIIQPGGSQTTGEAGIVIDGGVPDYTIEWSNGGDGYKETSLSPGHYSVTVTDENGCQDVLEFDINAPFQSQVSYQTTTCLSCSGSIQVTVAGGLPPVEVAITNLSTGETTLSNNAYNLCAAHYVYTITDGSGNVVQDTLDLGTSSRPQIQLDSIQNTICPGDSTGLIFVAVSGGVPAYNFRWSNGDSSATLHKLLPGVYALTVTDAAGCVDTVRYQLDSLKAVLTSISKVPAGCTVSGEATVMALQGNGPFKWHWSTGDTTARVENLWAGKYFVTVSDSLGCRRSDTITIEQEGGITIVGQIENAHCDEASDGAIEITPLTSNGNITYAWSTGAFTSKITKLRKGTYSVTMTDELGCELIEQFEVANFPLHPFSFEVKQNLCSGQNLASVITQGVDLQNFQFLWSDGTIQTKLENLSEGNYQLTITDTYGCSQQRVFVLQDPPSLITEITWTPPACFGIPDGMLVIKSQGGTGAIVHSVNGVITPDSLTNLGSGSYSILTQDANGCAIEEVVQMAYKSNPTISGLVKEAACDSSGGGEIKLTASGGVEPYSCRWDTGQTGTDLTNIAAGLYVVTCTDQLGCLVTDTFFVPGKNGPLIQLSGSKPSCNGGQDGTLTIGISSGNEPFDIFINGNKVAGTELSNLYAGIYLVEVKDAKGCKALGQYELTEPPLLTATITGLVQPNANTTTGSASARAMGGVAPYTYKWDNGQLGETAVNLLPGIHHVSIADAYGCSTELEIAIVKSKIYANWQAADNLCFGECNGKIAIDIQNEDGTEVIQWSDGALGKERTGLCAGIYHCTLTDAYGNEVTFSDIAVQTPPALQMTISIDGETCPGKNDGKATVTLSGGRPTYTILWDGILGAADAIKLDTGTHQIKIVDTNGCIKDSTIMIPPKIATPIVVNTTHILCKSKGKINIESEGNTAQMITINGAPYVFDKAMELVISNAGIYSIQQQLSDSCTIDLGSWQIDETSFVLGGVHSGVIEVKEGAEIDLDLGSLTFNGNYQIVWTGLPSIACGHEDTLGNCIRYTYVAEASHQVTAEVTSSEGCDTLIVFDIRVLADNEVFFPNAFGAGSDLSFKPVDKTGNTFIYKFSIYDRWGNLLYEEREKNIGELRGWDGHFQGKAAETGVYIYTMDTKLVRTTKKLYLGNVTLIR